MTKYEFHRLSQINPQEYNRLRWQQYKQTLSRHKNCAEKNVCVHQTNRKKTIKILQTLIAEKGLQSYNKTEIQDAIRTALFVKDKRTVKGWFEFIWQQQYLAQPTYGLYVLDIERIIELEVDFTVVLDENQRRLFNV